MNSPFIKVTDYNRLSDVVMYLSKNCVLKFNVMLYNNIKDYISSFHSEFRVFDSKFNSDRYYLNRRFKYYLSIETIGTELKSSIPISVNEMTMCQMMMNSALEWFTSNEYSDLYAVKNNRLVLTRAVEPKHMICSGKMLKIEPMVFVDYMDNTDFGVRLYLDSEDVYCEMSMNTFLGLQYTINSIDLYQCAIGLINYLQRPELGTNLTASDTYIDKTNKYSEEVKEESVRSFNKTGRKINTNSNCFKKDINNL